MKPKLSEEVVQERLAQAEGWNLEDGKWIVKKFRFRRFMTGIAYVNEVAEIAEQANHHPFIAVDYRVVTLRMTSWNAGGLTEADFTLARRFDEAYERIAANADSSA